MIDWSVHLEPGEEVRWEGRPAPRCFVYRYWRHSVFGLLLLLFSVFWEMVGLQLGAVYDSPAIAWVPVPFIAVALYLAFGHLILARLEWEKVFFAVTGRRILARRGVLRPRLEVLHLSELTHFRLKRTGEELGSFQVTGGDPPRTVMLPCLEYPTRLSALLESALAANNRLERKAGVVAPAPARD